MIDCGIPLGFEVEEGAMEIRELLDRRHPFVARTTMGRPAGHVKAEDERAAVCRNDREARWFGDDGGVGAIPAKDGCECSRATIFLGDHALDNDVAAELDAGITHCDERVKTRGEPGFHVAAATAKEPILIDLASNR